MNKTVTINLGGTVFHIDDNAYDALTQYLNSIKSRFSAEQGRDEIMQDIESRIGEMFSERLGNSRQVITLADVDEITRLMGKPEEFASAEEEASSSSSTSIPLDGKTYKRRVFRDPDHKVIGGVCGGLAAYFDVDPIWIRLAFIIATVLWGFGFWVYIIMWIIVPKAETTAEKLMMRGEPVTISNIEKNVREEMEAMKYRVQQGTKPGSPVSRFFDALGQILRYFFKALGKVIAVFLVFIGLIIGLSLFASLIGFAMPGVTYPIVLNHMFSGHTAVVWVMLGIFLAVGIPFLMLAYWGLRVVFNIRRRSKAVGIAALSLWILGVILIAIHGINIGKDFAERDNFKKQLTLQQPANKMLIVESNLKGSIWKKYDSSHRHGGGDFDLTEDNDTLKSSNVRLDIVKSPTDSFELVQVYYANGRSRKAAVDNASGITYSFTQTDSVITFNDVFTLSKDSKWRNQRVQLILRVPVGGRVKLDESLEDVMFDIENIQNILDSDMLNRTWEMTEKGLNCLDCDGSENVVGRHRIHINSEDGAEVDISEEGVHIHHNKIISL